MTKRKFDLLKNLYERAKENKQEILIFEGKTLFTDFVEQLIEYYKERGYEKES